MLTAWLDYYNRRPQLIVGDLVCFSVLDFWCMNADWRLNCGVCSTFQRVFGTGDIVSCRVTSLFRRLEIVWSGECDEVRSDQVTSNVRSDALT